MTTQFQNKYQSEFSPRQIGEIMTQDQWKRARATGCEDAIREMAAEIATDVRATSQEKVFRIIEEQIQKAKAI